MKNYKTEKKSLVALPAKDFMQCVEAGRYPVGYWQPRPEGHTVEEFENSYQGKWRILQDSNPYELQYVQRACALGFSVEDAHRDYVPFETTNARGVEQKYSFYRQLPLRTDPVNMRTRVFMAANFADYRPFDEFIASSVKLERSKPSIFDMPADKNPPKPAYIQIRELNNTAGAYTSIGLSPDVAPAVLSENAHDAPQSTNIAKNVSTLQQRGSNGQGEVAIAQDVANLEADGVVLDEFDEYMQTH